MGLNQWIREIKRQRRERLAQVAAPMARGFPDGFWRSPGEPIRWWQKPSWERLLEPGEEIEYATLTARVEFPAGGHTYTRPVWLIVTNRAVGVIKLTQSQYGFGPIQVLERLPLDTFFGPLFEDPNPGWRRWQRHYILLDGKKYWVAPRAYRNAQERDALLVADSGSYPHFPSVTAAGDQ